MSQLIPLLCHIGTKLQQKEMVRKSKYFVKFWQSSMIWRIFPECWLYSQPHSNLGDGICDDNFNYLACNYDQGDCCFGIKGLFCTYCECKDENTNYPLITSTQAGECIFHFTDKITLWLKITHHHFIHSMWSWSIYNWWWNLWCRSCHLGMWWIWWRRLYR